MDTRIEEIFIVEVADRKEKKLVKKSRKVLVEAEDFLVQAVDDKLRGRMGEC